MKISTFVWCFFLSLPPVVADESENLETFRKVWHTVKEKHWDLEGTGVDWDEMHRLYEPRAQSAESEEDLRRVLREMLAELGQSHFAILAPESSREIRSLQMDFPGGPGETGFEVAPIDGRLFIVDVDLDYDAAKKGLGIGTEILP